MLRSRCRPVAVLRVGVAVAVLAVAVGVAGCGDDGTSAGSGAPSGSGGAALAGDLTVFAAASLTEPFQDAEPVLEAAHRDLHLTYSFAGSGALVAQVRQGAPADVIATADRSSMAALEQAGLVGPPRTFARNRLEILVAAGNPHHVDDLADLADPGLKVVLADDGVPAGRYAAEALSQAGVGVAPVSKELDVKAAVAKVTSGEADATIAYVTDVEAVGDRGTGVEIPDDQNVVAAYPIAIVSGTRHRAAAEAFVRSAVSGDVAEALARRGFDRAG